MGREIDAAMLLLKKGGGADDSALKRRVELLWKLADGIVWDAETDEQAGYQKTVPAGAMGAELISVSGQTIVWNQLVDADTEAVLLESGATYLTVIDGVAAVSAGSGAEVSVSGGTDQVFDLTAMFGAGDEPESTDDPRIAAIEAYAAAHPAFSAGALLSADVTEIVSQDSSQAVLGSCRIPDALREAYPLRSTRSSADAYALADRKHEQRVYEYTFTGDEVITHQGTMSSVVSTQFSPADNDLPEMKDVGGVYGGDLLAAAIPFRADQSNTVHVACRNNTIRLFTPADFGTGGSVAKCKAYLKHLYEAGTPLVVAYVLKDPVVSDIAGFLPEDPLLDVEAGGSLTFTQAGTALPVPNRVDYLVKAE